MRKSSGVLFICAVVVCLLLTPNAGATTFTLTSGTSTAHVDAGSQAGTYSWTINGTEQLYQDWFWYRVGASGPESSLNTLTALSQTQGAGNTLDLSYGGTGFTVDLSIILTGGSGDQGTLQRTVTVTNTAAGSILNFNLFQYTDFDLNRLNLADHVCQTAPGTFVQTAVSNGGTVTNTATVPNQHETNYYANTLLSLDDLGTTTLNGVGCAGPGDVTFAYEWNRDLGGQESFQIISTADANAVPEPGSMLLLGSGVLGLVGALRRKLSI